MLVSGSVFDVYFGNLGRFQRRLRRGGVLSGFTVHQDQKDVLFVLPDIYLSESP